ncbi:putative Basic-leucine zipper transcription factor family protein [Hibiscus syriacus]|uniref:Basic-leucine zipper transcription factor family protein n=1 Tax=Hibiscus syriacus TaxID=106335 RepID=A0A6A2Y864_HIBSY|nr:putative Basic-leucine zipper transcription factor family protein [Hibiscus syriacus]
MNHTTSVPNQIYPGSSQWIQIVRGEHVHLPFLSSSSMAMMQPPVTPEVEGEAEEDAENVNVGPMTMPVINWLGTNLLSLMPSGSDMEASIWPPLSGSSRAISKSSSDLYRASLNGSSSTSFVPISEGSSTASTSSSLQKQVRNNVNLNPNLIPSHTMPARQRSMKQNSNVSASNGGLSQPHPQGLMVDVPLNGSSSRDHIQRIGFVPYSVGNDQRYPWNSFRQCNSGLHPQGNGPRHLNYGGRRNQDHGSQDWNGRNFTNRDGHIQLRGVPSFMRHPPTTPPLPQT